MVKVIIEVLIHESYVREFKDSIESFLEDRKDLIEDSRISHTTGEFENLSLEY